jgi:hypothetical protein
VTASVPPVIVGPEGAALKEAAEKLALLNVEEFERE